MSDGDKHRRSRGLVCNFSFHRVFCVSCVGQLSFLHPTSSKMYLYCTCMFSYGLNTGTVSKKTLYLSETTRLNKTKTGKAVCTNVTLAVTEGRGLVGSFCRAPLPLSPAVYSRSE
jgi:hypothetical protein